MWTPALARSWQVPSPASPHCSRTVLLTTYGGRRGPERAGGAHANNHPSFEGRDFLGGELLPSAWSQALPKAPHAVDPCITNTLGPELQGYLRGELPGLTSGSGLEVKAELAHSHSESSVSLRHRTALLQGIGFILSMKKGHRLSEHVLPFHSSVSRNSSSNCFRKNPRGGQVHGSTSPKSIPLAEAVPPGPPQPETLSCYSPGWVSPDHSLPLFHPVNGKFTPPLW